MLYKLKRLLFRIMPLRLYLSTLQIGFRFLFVTGLLKRDERFKFHYACKKLINKADVVIDMGANLGYFSSVFARLNPQGRLYAFEPIPLFKDRLTKKLHGFAHVEIINAALGAQEGVLNMVMPSQNGMIRTGLPHVIEAHETEKYQDVLKVPVIEARKFLESMPRLNYIKCDIEGYEWVVFETLKSELNRLRPIVQIEISEKYISDFQSFFEGIDYIQTGLYSGKLIEENGPQKVTSDFLFIPSERKVEIFSKFKA